MKADLFSANRIVIRSRLLSVPIWLVLALIAGTLMAASFSARQPATVALDTGISIIRLALPLWIVLLSQELFSHEFERKLYLTSLTYPRPRIQWLLGRLVTITLFGLALLAIMSLVLATITHFASGNYEQGTPVSLGIPYITTLFFIAVDMLVTITMASLIAISASTSTFILIGTFGFVLIARGYTPIIELLKNNPNAVSSFADPRLYQDSLGLLSFLLPDLGRLDIRMTALYDKMAFLPTDWPLLLLATLAYASVLGALSAWIINKREFS